MHRYLLTLQRTPPAPAEKLPILAADDEEANALAKVHVLMSNGVTAAIAYRDGRECFRIERGDHLF
jgi:hypothetical protein